MRAQLEPLSLSPWAQAWALASSSWIYALQDSECENKLQPGKIQIVVCDVGEKIEKERKSSFCSNLLFVILTTPDLQVRNYFVVKTFLVLRKIWGCCRVLKSDWTVCFNVSHYLLNFSKTRSQCYKRFIGLYLQVCKNRPVYKNNYSPICCLIHYADTCFTKFFSRKAW